MGGNSEMMKHVLRLLAMTTVAVGFLAAPASAHFTPPGSLTVDTTAIGSSTTVKISGTIACDSNEKFRVRVISIAGSNVTGLDAGNNCSGGVQPYDVTASGTGFVSGNPTVCVRAQTGLPGGTSPHKTSNIKCETVSLTV